MIQRIGCHLTYEQRCHISAYKRSGISNRAIAKLIGCSHTTINRELKRNLSRRGYRPTHAHNRAISRRVEASATARKMTHSVIELIRKMLLETQSSPVQISGRLARERGIRISHESIYRYIWAEKRKGGELYLQLRHRAKKYNKRSGKLAGRGLIPNRRDISERPLEVEKKERFGDFELDTIVGAGRKGAIVSVVDRSSKFVFLRLIHSATAENVTQAISEALYLLSKNRWIRTMTSDNGKEFSHHEKVVAAVGGEFYFAKPYRSWERGLNEHTNGLVRQYFPKGTDFTTLTKEAVAIAEQKLNNRPRKILNYETPLEALTRMTQLNLSGNIHC